MTITPKPRRTVLLWAAPALLVLTLAAGCSSSDVSPMSQDASGTSDLGTGGLAAPEEAGRDAYLGGDVANGLVKDGVTSSSGSGSTAGSPVEVARQSVISKGNVSLRADDVAKARFDVQKVVDAFGGEISDEQTTTDEEGRVNTSRMVLRIPSAEFTEVMQELESVADLESSRRTSEDVTTQVIDLEVRLKVQRASIDRIQALLVRANSIRDIVAIETQLTQRQAELNSLEQQQAYLADQTSLSTVIVHLERTSDEAEPKDEKGFVAGLKSGWDGLTTFATELATLTGVLLPFLVVLLVLAGLALPLARPVLRRLRRSPATPAPAAPLEG